MGTDMDATQLQRFLFNLSQQTRTADLPKGCEKKWLPAEPDNMSDAPLTSWLRRIAMEERTPIAVDAVAG